MALSDNAAFNATEWLAHEFPPPRARTKTAPATARAESATSRQPATPALQRSAPPRPSLQRGAFFPTHHELRLGRPLRIEDLLQILDAQAPYFIYQTSVWLLASDLFLADVRYSASWYELIRKPL
jgi:hypothetical protein